MEHHLSLDTVETYCCRHSVSHEETEIDEIEVDAWVVQLRYVKKSFRVCVGTSIGSLSGFESNFLRWMNFFSAGIDIKFLEAENSMGGFSLSNIPS
jgi:hypothetical protein